MTDWESIDGIECCFSVSASGACFYLSRLRESQSALHLSEGFVVVLHSQIALIAIA